ncbi:MAG: hypothetical protein EA403_04495 [Spirochaetaceae bacterium]|nr:MAG: hypothetical protein EA403_04495 [Spirochaetaceae bacterium]
MNIRAVLTSRKLSVSGYIILGGFTAVVFGGGFVVAVSHHPAAAAIMGLWCVGLVIEAVSEWRAACCSDSEEQRFRFPTDSLSFLSVAGGTVVTFWISTDLALGPVVASGLVGIFAAAFLKPYAAPIFAGSFVGMASSGLFDYPTIIIAGMLAGGVFVVGKHVFNGFGGKLGTTAWAGCVGALLLVNRPMLSAPVPGWDVGLPLLVACVAGAMVTFILSIWFGQGPVMASGMVGLAAGLLLPPLFGAELGTFLAVGAFCASFAGMSGTNRFEKVIWMVPAGVLCGLALLYSTPFMGGGGGKLGTIAFGAVIGLRGLMRVGGLKRPDVITRRRRPALD